MLSKAKAALIAQHYLEVFKKHGAFIIVRSVQCSDCEYQHCQNSHAIAWEFVHVATSLSFCSLDCLDRELEKRIINAKFERLAEISSGGQV